ncbi:MAG TPA: IS1595 family transposase [Bryobacteraceae bacterium]|jgi:transposase-like protein|nr:IS1595 family transposase [Bryobacteraceae bacterium]
MAGKTHRVGPSIIQTAKDFASEETCHNYLEAARWPEGVRCLQCGGSAISKFTVKGKTRVSQTGVAKTGPDRFMYQCLEKTCKYQFAATTGTIFSDTHLPLRVWMQAIALLCTAKKGISAKQMERTMGVSYKTAWYLNHRIRKAMDEGIEGLFTGTVEADETYVGGRYDKRRKRAKYDKEPVFGMKERETGRVHAKHIRNATSWSIGREIDSAVGPTAKMMTDESRLYANLQRKGFDHEIVIHSDKQWVRGDCHTQGIDGFWSLLKRGLIGSFHQVSHKHLGRYIAEFQFRFNRREDEEIFAAVVIGLLAKGALRYKALTGPETAVSDPPSADPSLSDDDLPF